MSMEGNPDVGSPVDAAPSVDVSAAPSVDVSAAQANPAPAPTWRDGLPAELRESKSLAKFETVNDLALGYTNAESLIGRDKIPMPKTEQEFLAAFDRLGRPKDVDGYDLTVDGAQYGEQVDSIMKKDLDWFKDTAHKVGLTTTQAKALYDGYLSNFSEAFRQRDASIEYEMQAAEGALMSEFGRDYKRNMALANRALSFYGTPELIKAIETSGLGRNPDFVKMMHKLGMERQEEIGIDKGGVSASGKTIAAAIDEAMLDPAYTDATHPGHKQAVDRVNLLFQRAHSD